MPLVVAFCVTLMLLSMPQRDWLVRRIRRAQAAMRDLRRAMRLPDYAWMVDEGVPQLEQACSALFTPGDATTSGDETLLSVVHHHARTLSPVVREHLRMCRDVAALLDTAAPAEALRAGELHHPLLRAAALADAWGQRMLAPLHHLRLHLALLHWGLRRSLTSLERARRPLQPADRRRLAGRGADVGTLARASARASAALLRSPTLLLREPPATGESGRPQVM